MIHAESTTIDEWNSLADLLANLIAKYAHVLDLDEPAVPSDINMIPFQQGSPKSGAFPAFAENMSSAA